VSGRRSEAPKRHYHHGDLAAALIGAGLELTRTGGPEALGIREATRQVGVSPNAAYRHFADRQALLEAVSAAIQARMAEGMAALAPPPRSGSAASRAVGRLRAVGLGYIEFALAEPGWFSVAFFGAGAPHFGPAHDPAGPSSAAPHLEPGRDPGDRSSNVADLEPADEQTIPTRWPTVPNEAAEHATSAGPVPPPYLALTAALDGMVEAGLLTPAQRLDAEWPCWSAVHGFAELCLRGPLRHRDGVELRALAARTVDAIIAGLPAAHVGR